MSVRGPSREVFDWTMDVPGKPRIMRDDAPDWVKEEWERFCNTEDLIEVTEEEFERELASDK